MGVGAFGGAGGADVMGAATGMAVDAAVGVVGVGCVALRHDRQSEKRHAAKTRHDFRMVISRTPTGAVLLGGMP